MYNWDVYKQQDPGVQSLIKWQFNEHGGFWTAIWKAISNADTFNLDRMEKAFPLEVAAYRKYVSQYGWWEALLEKLRTPRVIDGKKEE